MCKTPKCLDRISETKKMWGLPAITSVCVFDFNSRLAAILDFCRNELSYFWSTSHFDISYQVSSQMPFGSGEEIQNKFSRWR